MLMSAAVGGENSARANNVELLKWLGKQTDEFLLRIHDLGLKEVIGTSNVLIIDEQIPGEPKLWVKPVQVIEALQHQLGPSPVILRTAAEKRTKNFPAIYTTISTIDPVGKTDIKSARITNPCNLPIVTADGVKLARGRNRQLPIQNASSVFSQNEINNILHFLATHPKLCASIAKQSIAKQSHASPQHSEDTSSPPTKIQEPSNTKIEAAKIEAAKIEAVKIEAPSHSQSKIQESSTAKSQIETSNATSPDTVSAGTAAQNTISGADVRLVWAELFQTWIDLQDLTSPN